MFVEIQTVEMRLRDSDSSSGNKSDKSTPKKQETVQSEVL
jgi:hypothetical protein